MESLAGVSELGASADGVIPASPSIQRQDIAPQPPNGAPLSSPSPPPGPTFPDQDTSPPPMAPPSAQSSSAHSESPSAASLTPPSASPSATPSAPPSAASVALALRPACSVCEERFDGQEALLEHMASHQVTHRFSCRKCVFLCRTKHQLADHIRKQHVTLKRRQLTADGVDRRLRCVVCGIDSFPSFSYFHAHHLYHHLLTRPAPVVVLEPLPAAPPSGLRLTLRRNSSEPAARFQVVQPSFGDSPPADSEDSAATRSDAASSDASAATAGSPPPPPLVGRRVPHSEDWDAWRLHAEADLWAEALGGDEDDLWERPRRGRKRGGRAGGQRGARTSAGREGRGRGQRERRRGRGRGRGRGGQDSAGRTDDQTSGPSLGAESGDGPSGSGSNQTTVQQTTPGSGSEQCPRPDLGGGPASCPPASGRRGGQRGAGRGRRGGAGTGRPRRGRGAKTGVQPALSPFTVPASLPPPAAVGVQVTAPSGPSGTSAPAVWPQPAAPSGGQTSQQQTPPLVAEAGVTSPAPPHTGVQTSVPPHVSLASGRSLAPPYSGQPCVEPPVAPHVSQVRLGSPVSLPAAQVNVRPWGSSYGHPSTSDPSVSSYGAQQFSKPPHTALRNAAPSAFPTGAQTYAQPSLSPHIAHPDVYPNVNQVWSPPVAPASGQASVSSQSAPTNTTPNAPPPNSQLPFWAPAVNGVTTSVPFTSQPHSTQTELPPSLRPAAPASVIQATGLVAPAQPDPRAPPSGSGRQAAHSAAAVASRPAASPGNADLPPRPVVGAESSAAGRPAVSAQPAPAAGNHPAAVQEIDQTQSTMRQRHASSEPAGLPMNNSAPGPVAPPGGPGPTRRPSADDGSAGAPRPPPSAVVPHLIPIGSARPPPVAMETPVAAQPAAISPAAPRPASFGPAPHAPPLPPPPLPPPQPQPQPLPQPQPQSAAVASLPRLDSLSAACHLCGVPLPNVAAAQQHAAVYHGRPYPCRICSFWPATRSEMEHHLTTVHGGAGPRTEAARPRAARPPAPPAPARPPLPPRPAHPARPRFPPPSLPLPPQPPPAKRPRLAAPPGPGRGPVYRPPAASAAPSDHAAVSSALAERGVTLTAARPAGGGGEFAVPRPPAAPSGAIVCRWCKLSFTSRALLLQHEQEHTRQQKQQQQQRPQAPQKRAAPPVGRGAASQLVVPVFDLDVANAGRMEALGVCGFLPVSRLGENTGQLGLPVVSVRGITRMGPSPRPVAFFHLGEVFPLR